MSMLTYPDLVRYRPHLDNRTTEDLRILCAKGED